MNRNTFLILSWCIIAVLLTILFWPDKQRNLHEDHHTDVIANNDTLKAHEAQHTKIIDSLTKTIQQKDSANKSLREGQATTRRQLDLKTAQVKDLTIEIREYNKDTGYFGHLLDSLQTQVENLTYLVAQYEQYADSINTVNDSLRLGYNVMIKEKDKAKAELQLAYDKLLRAYEELFDTSRVLMKDLKKQKFLTKVVAVLAGAAAVLGLMK